jgi:ABC-type nickel/cobalt efflux system permease component RcnA
VLPRDVAIACATGMGLGGLGLGTALALLVIVGVLYLVLARARRARASDWLALGYTAAVVLATALLMLWEVARELYAEMNVAVW